MTWWRRAQREPQFTVQADQTVLISPEEVSSTEGVAALRGRLLAVSTAALVAEAPYFIKDLRSRVAARALSTMFFIHAIPVRMVNAQIGIISKWKMQSARQGGVARQDVAALTRKWAAIINGPLAVEG